MLKTNWMKITVVLVLFTGSLIVKFGGMIQDADVPVPDDKIHNWTLGLNKFTMKHDKFRDAWQILASLSLDVQFFLVCGWWLYKGYSLRTVIAILMFYVIRAILQQLFILPFPDHFYWEYPGFP